MPPSIAPCVPLWVMLERDGGILNSAAFVMEDGALRGSGFFAFIEEGEYAFNYFVTAAHVVWGDRRKRDAKYPPDGEVTLRVNRTRDGGIIEVPLKKADWHYHQDRFVDLCAIPLDAKRYQLLSECSVNVLHIARLAASVATLLHPILEFLMSDALKEQRVRSIE